MLKSAVAFVSLFFLASCGSDSGGSTGPDPDPPVPTSVSVSPSSATLDALGATTQFSATVLDQNGQTMASASVAWSSTNTSVLTVSSSGLGTAVAVGDATVTATSGTASGTAAAIVQQVPVQLQTDLASDNVAPGGTIQASVTIHDARGSAIPSPTVTWTSSDPAVATVEDGGMVTGVAPGLAFIKAAAGNLSDSAQVSVADALQQEQMTILTNTSGEAGIFSELGGGTHLQIVVENELGAPLQGATVEYGEDAVKAYLAVRKEGYAPAFVFGTVEELKEFGEPYTPAPETVADAAALGRSGPQRVVTDAIRLRIALPDIADAELSVIQDALRIETFFHKFGPVTLGADQVLFGRGCMTWDDFASLQIARLNSVPGWVDGVIELIREEDPTYFDPVPVPGDVKFYFSARDVVNLLTGTDLLAEKVNLLGAALAEDPTGRRVEVEWDFGDTGPPVRKGLGTFKVRTNDAYCGGAIPSGIFGSPPAVSGLPGGTVQGTVVAKSEWGTVVPGVDVTFSLDAGNGTLPGGPLELVVTTDENGKATVSWTLPGTEGSYTLTASAEGADGQPLTATITGNAETLLPSAAALATGNDHTCGLTLHDGAFCWGRNSYGEVGIGKALIYDGVIATRTTPASVLTTETFDVITAGDTHTCGLTEPGPGEEGGVAFCWGRNRYLQVGPWAVWTPVTVPTRVPNVPNFSDLVSGSFHTCGLTPDGKAYCWGRNDQGQLGTGELSESENPVAVDSPVTFSALAAGGFHTCGIEDVTGSVYCWGQNDRGQLGLGLTEAFPIPTPTVITALSGFTALAAGWYHTCGVTTAQNVYCWGRNNYGQLGRGSSNDDRNPTPAPILSVSGFTSVTAGAGHTCGVTGDSAYCWGRNDQGMLGIGDNADRDSPVTVSGGLGFQALSAGAFHTCGLTADGTAYCWGDNVDWQIGDSTFDDRNLPTPVMTTRKFGRPPSG